MAENKCSKCNADAAGFFVEPDGMMWPACLSCGREADAQRRRSEMKVVKDDSAETNQPT